MDGRATDASTVASAANGKDTTVNAISSTFNWFKNDFTNGSSGGASDNVANKNGPVTQSPAKIYNNEKTMIKLTNYEKIESAAENMTLSKKLYNTDVNNIEPNVLQNDISTYSNYGQMVQSNNTQQMTTKCTKTLNNVANSNNISGSTTNTNNAYAIATELYGSVAGGGNVYDIVASSGNSDYYQIIQPNESQTVIYDEVAADDDLMRPHRPAPGPPSGPSVLSAQQIQRRIERAQKEQSQQQQQQLYDNLNSSYANGFGGGGGSGKATTRNHYIYEEIMQKNSNTNFNGINAEAKETINAASSETMKHTKIDHLLR